MALPKFPISTGIHFPKLEDEQDKFGSSSGTFDDLLNYDFSSTPKAPEEGFLGKLSSGVGSVLHNTIGLPKQGIDWLAREITDAEEPAGTTAGQIIEEQLLGKADPNAGFGAKFGRTLLRGGLDIGLDPTTYAAGLGVLSKAGKVGSLISKIGPTATRALELADPLFKAQMGLGVAHGLSEGLPELYHHGATGRAGELLGEATISGAGLALPHVLRGADPYKKGLKNLEGFANAGEGYVDSLRHQAFNDMADAGEQARVTPDVWEGERPTEFPEQPYRDPSAGMTLPEEPFAAPQAPVFEPPTEPFRPKEEPLPEFLPQEAPLDLTPERPQPPPYSEGGFTDLYPEQAAPRNVGFDQFEQPLAEPPTPEPIEPRPVVDETPPFFQQEVQPMAPPVEPSALQRKLETDAIELEDLKKIFGEHSLQYQKKRSELMGEQVKLQKEVDQADQMAPPMLPQEGEQLPLPFDQTAPEATQQAIRRPDFVDEAQGVHLPPDAPGEPVGFPRGNPEPPGQPPARPIEDLIRPLVDVVDRRNLAEGVTTNDFEGAVRNALNPEPPPRYVPRPTLEEMGHGEPTTKDSLRVAPEEPPLLLPEGERLMPRYASDEWLKAHGKAVPERQPSRVEPIAVTPELEALQRAAFPEVIRPESEIRRVKETPVAQEVRPISGESDLPLLAREAENTPGEVRGLEPRAGGERLAPEVAPTPEQAARLGGARSDEGVLNLVGKPGEDVRAMRGRMAEAYTKAEALPSGLKLVDLDQDFDKNPAAEFLRSEKTQPALRAIKNVADRIVPGGRFSGFIASTDIQGQLANGEVTVNPVLIARKAERIVERNVRELGRKGVKLSATEKSAMQLDIMAKKLIHTLGHEQAHTEVPRDFANRSHTLAHREAQAAIAERLADEMPQLRQELRDALAPHMRELNSTREGTTANKYRKLRIEKNAARKLAKEARDAGLLREQSNALAGTERGGSAVGGDLGGGGIGGVRSPADEGYVPAGGGGGVGRGRGDQGPQLGESGVQGRGVENQVDRSDSKTVPTFYSEAERQAAKLPQAMKGEDVWRFLNGKGVKADEMKWTGLDEYLSGKPRVTPKEVQDFLRENRVEVQEVVKGSSGRLSEGQKRELRQWLDENPGITRNPDDLIERASRGDENAIGDLEQSAAPEHLMEGLHTEDGGNTKFSQYQLPGGENYRELLLTRPEAPRAGLLRPDLEAELAPLGRKIADLREARRNAAEAERPGPARQARVEAITKEIVALEDKRTALEDQLTEIQDRQRAKNFQGGHYDEPNILAHVRFNERTDAQGKKVLFIEEIQSDWAQKGRREGFARPSQPSDIRVVETDTGWGVDVNGQRMQESADRASAERAAERMRSNIATKETGSVPEGPFVGDTPQWSALAMKRMIRWAAEHGFDKVAWTKGEQQAARYDLSKQINKIEWSRNSDGTHALDITDLEGDRVRLPAEMGRMTPKQIEESVGKDIADKIVNSTAGEGELSGLDLQVGGEGMKGFYDKILPTVAGKLGKKFGARVGETELGTGGKINEESTRYRAVTEDGRVLSDSASFEEISRLRSENPRVTIRAELAPSVSGPKVHSLDITPQMKKSVMEEGQSLFFQRDKLGEVPLPADRFRIAEHEDGVPPAKLSKEDVLRYDEGDKATYELATKQNDDYFITRAAKGKLTPEDTSAWQMRVRAKEQAVGNAYAELSKVKAEGGDVAAAQRKSDAIAANYLENARLYSDLGRNVRARPTPSKGSPLDAVQRIIKEYDLNAVQSKHFLDVFHNDPNQLPELMRLYRNPSLFQKVLEYQKAGMVSAIPTQIANPAGNIGEFTSKLGETWISGMVDKYLKGGSRKPAAEVGAELRGAMNAAGPGLRELGAGLKEIFTLMPEKWDPNLSLDYVGGAIGKGGRVSEAISKATGKDFHLGRFVRIPLRMLGTVDKFFQTMGKGAEIGKLSFREAVKELGDKASPEALRAKAIEIQNEIHNADTPRGLKLAEQVAELQKERTFQETPPEFVRSLNAFKQKHPWMNMVLPFTTTPGNILRRVIQRSPLGFKKVITDYRAGKFDGNTAAFADAIARPILGTAMLGGFVAAAKSGLMTGSGPSDPKELAMLKSSGWQPYSVVKQNADGTQTYIPFSRFEPVSSLLSIAADMGTLGDVKDEETADRVVGSLLSNLVSKTYLRGLSDAAMVISDPKKSGGQLLRSVAGTVVPNIVTKTGQAFDSKVYDTKPSAKGWAALPEQAANAVLADLPGAPTLEPRYDSTGHVMERPGNAFERAFSPIPTSTSKPNAPLVKELLRVGVTLPETKNSIRLEGVSVPLSPRERDIYIQGQQELETALKNLTSSNAYKKLPDTRAEGGRNSKEGYIRSVIDGVNTRTRQRIIADNDFKRRFRTARRETLMGRVPNA